MLFHFRCRFGFHAEVVAHPAAPISSSVQSAGHSESGASSSAEAGTGSHAMPLTLAAAGWVTGSRRPQLAANSQSCGTAIAYDPVMLRHQVPNLARLTHIFLPFFVFRIKSIYHFLSHFPTIILFLFLHTMNPLFYLWAVFVLLFTVTNLFL